MKEILNKVLALIEDRSSERDTDKERSMKKCVAIFNAITDRELSEQEGWIFMQCLKIARAQQGSYREDDYLDKIAYSLLELEHLNEIHKQQ